jgi:pyrimidine operon attenuation protein/uracil phosphoribosyltransferase
MQNNIVENLSNFKRVALCESDDVNVIIRKIASKIAAKYANEKSLAIIGILRRGAPLADLILQELKELVRVPGNILRVDFNVKRYADDLSILYPHTLLTLDPLSSSVNLEGYHIVLVDDVIFTGSSILKVIEYLLTKNPASISTACLVDRLNSKYSIQSEFVGLYFQANPQFIIECNVPPYEPSLKIDLAFPTKYLQQ